MATSTPPGTTSASVAQEQTFRAYSQAKGQTYATNRLDYDPSVYQAVLDAHKLNDGQLGTLVDVGCGPGFAARALAPYFDTVIGLDPSKGMVEAAKSMGGVTQSSKPIRFEVSTAEDLGQHLEPAVADSSVDLITASNAAHWFDLQNFWETAARVLKPGGTVAIWTSGDIRVHSSVPNADAIQKEWDEITEEHLIPYYMPGNFLLRDRYRNLLLPWTIPEPVTEFDKASFVRKEWQPGEEFYGGSKEFDMDTLEKLLATTSPHTRWREAHPEDAGTERDMIKVIRRMVEKLVREAGVEPGQEKIRGEVQGALLVVKKGI